MIVRVLWCCRTVLPCDRACVLVLLRRSTLRSCMSSRGAVPSCPVIRRWGLVVLGELGSVARVCAGCAVSSGASPAITGQEGTGPRTPRVSYTDAITAPLGRKVRPRLAPTVVTGQEGTAPARTYGVRWPGRHGPGHTCYLRSRHPAPRRAARTATQTTPEGIPVYCGCRAAMNSCHVPFPLTGGQSRICCAEQSFVIRFRHGERPEDQRCSGN